MTVSVTSCTTKMFLKKQEYGYNQASKAIQIKEVVFINEESGEIKQLFVYEHHAGRLELLIRILYWIAIGIVLAIYGFIAEICLIIQWFVILILGHRNEGLSNFIKGYLEYAVHVRPYVYLMTDRRPGIMPETVKIYEKEEGS